MAAGLAIERVIPLVRSERFPGLEVFGESDLQKAEERLAAYIARSEAVREKLARESRTVTRHLDLDLSLLNIHSLPGLLLEDPALRSVNVTGTLLQRVDFADLGIDPVADALRAHEHIILHGL